MTYAKSIELNELRKQVAELTEICDTQTKGLSNLTKLVSELEQERDALVAHCDTLLYAISEAKHVFLHYAELHSKKGTDDGKEKAMRNWDLAKALDAVEKQAPQQSLAEHDAKVIEEAIDAVDKEISNYLEWRDVYYVLEEYANNLKESSLHNQGGE